MASKRIKQMGRWLLQGIVLLVVVLSAERFLTRDAVRGNVPELRGRTVQGDEINLSSGTGKPVLIHFWATWCPICNLEHGAINSLARDYHVVSVAMQSGTAQELAAEIARSGIEYPVLADPDGLIADRFGVTGVPTSFIVDSQQQVKYVTRGYTTGAGLRARLKLVDE